jgi:hypothetical protein
MLQKFPKIFVKLYGPFSWKKKYIYSAKEPICKERWLLVVVGPASVIATEVY